MKTVTPFLMFKDGAEVAARLYTSLFPDGKILSTTPGPGGTVMAVDFQIAGQKVMAFNGGPSFGFASGFSFFISCETQAEVDELWEKLTADGGEEQPCGWLKDKFGVSWQIIPTALGKGLSGPNAGKVVQAMMTMKKLDIATLEAAAK